MQLMRYFPFLMQLTAMNNSVFTLQKISVLCALERRDLVTRGPHFIVSSLNSCARYSHVTLLPSHLKFSY